MRMHHYGLATENLERSMKVFEALGYEVSDPVLDPVQKVRVAFVSRKEELPIELVCDSESGGPTTGILSRVGSGLYHVCYEVDNIEETITALRAKGFLLRHKPVEAVAYNRRRIAWLYSRDIGLIELLEL
ncbi:MAG: VOC family protein [Thermodesulfobacteriota bacterium]|nr:VOC family protein [Thermodesulfobacteriota bacterium]